MDTKSKTVVPRVSDIVQLRGTPKIGLRSDWLESFPPYEVTFSIDCSYSGSIRLRNEYKSFHKLKERIGEFIPGPITNSRLSVDITYYFFSAAEVADILKQYAFFLYYIYQ